MFAATSGALQATAPAWLTGPQGACLTLASALLADDVTQPQAYPNLVVLHESRSPCAWSRRSPERRWVALQALTLRAWGRVARYATPGGFREAALAAGVRGDALRCVETTLRARLHMYAPGQPMARELAKNPTVLMVNDTLFAHGGVLPHHGAPWAALYPAPGGVPCSITGAPDWL